ncbi:Aste57867_634 [Aphanomyces stellatus]|uniref:Aste57867_634 protein n=1 Tax=Aphanomyces stellatus TaxID=120398 RepID=A0A485K8B9_9STRA|nr:hypothetical protein As57867_000633 [Aphanomyces stellatus]VFT77859.1 Aste57867_634 [Aphanomyces stellatus]
MDAPRRGLAALDADAFRHVVGYLDTRTLKSISITCHTFDAMVHVSSLWEAQFRRRWGRLNFAMDPACPCIVSPRLLAHCRGRCFRLLTHAVRRCPTHGDVEHSTIAASARSYRFLALPPLSVAFDGHDDYMGGHCCVRANAPFPVGVHATVCRVGDAYCNGLSRHTYFEVSIAHAEDASRPSAPPPMVSLGVVDGHFSVVGSQPGWTGVSLGYHGDDGKVFCDSVIGESYGPTFGVGDTVGCWVLDKAVAFSHNGVAAGAALPWPSNQGPFYGLVGVNVPHVVRWNFGQMPFAMPNAACTFMASNASA